MNQMQFPVPLNHFNNVRNLVHIAHHISPSNILDDFSQSGTQQINQLITSQGYMPPALQYFPNSTLALANPENLLGNHGNGPPLLSAPTTHLPTWPYVPHFL